ncbi:MAG: PBP1A family penicillin-binding protein [Thermoanaerobaculia bacterium]|nr:PBP1A family penicillin-binding protein [Thermoanaerobaculia bacterium]
MEFEPLSDRNRDEDGSGTEGETEHSSTENRGDGTKRRPPGRHLWRWAWLYVLLLGSATGIVVAAMIRMPEVDRLDDFTPGLVTRLYDRYGDEFETYAVENRILLEEGELPDLLVNAIVAVEDERFWDHGGIDLAGIVRAAISNIRAGEITQGASTLSMQLAENLFHTRGRSWDRKISEALLAVELEKRYSKQQILTMYANLVYLGEGNYGMEAAAQYYFNHSVDELSLPQAATLAGIPQRPNAYNPYRNPDLVVRRRNKVLRRMREEEMISEERYRSATDSPLLVVKRHGRVDDGVAEYFAEEIRRYLEDRYGSERLYDAGLQVRTTLDPAIQTAAERAVEEQLLALDHEKGWRGAPSRLETEDLEDEVLPSWTTDLELVPGRWYEGIVLEVTPSAARVRIGERTLPLEREGFRWTGQRDPRNLLSRGDVAWFRIGDHEEDLEDQEDQEDPPGQEMPAGEPNLLLEQEPEIEAAAIVLESATGAVRAMVGGWDFARSKFNRATQARRQVGSGFKPFVYGAALENGFTPADTLMDAPVSFRGADNQDSYSPRNYHREHHGIITLRRALERSVNVPAVKLIDLVGIDRTVDFAHRAGIGSELPPYPSLALGSADLVPLEVAAAYATIGNQGLYMDPHLVESVATPEGQILEEHLPQPRKAMERELAHVLTHMLEGVVERGTGVRLAQLPVALAGKTGTTNDYSDAWFVGFSPSHTILTWVGYDVKKSLGNRMTGARAALPIWKSIAEAGLEEGWLKEEASFSPPPEVTLLEVEYYSGRLPPPGGEPVIRTIQEAFVTGTEPTLTWDPKWGRVLDLPWYQQLVFYIPKEGERMPAAAEPVLPEIETAETTTTP